VYLLGKFVEACQSTSSYRGVRAVHSVCFYRSGFTSTSILIIPFPDSVCFLIAITHYAGRLQRLPGQMQTASSTHVQVTSRNLSSFSNHTFLALSLAARRDSKVPPEVGAGLSHGNN
jgi:hypothetical protein